MGSHGEPKCVCGDNTSEEIERQKQLRTLEKMIPRSPICIEPGHYPTECRSLDKLQRQRDQLLEALENMLMSQDCEWENKDQGHDWAEACRYARKIISNIAEE